MGVFIDMGTELVTSIRGSPGADPMITGIASVVSTTGANGAGDSWLFLTHSRRTGWIVLRCRREPFLHVLLESMRLGREASDLAKVGEVDAGADEAAGVHQDAETEHRKCPARVPDELIRRQIGDGRGFVVVRRLPVEDYSKDEIGMIFWGIGTHLGRDLSQSVLGDRLGHVKDFSREDPLARAYRNKQELSPHTHSCDLVGLACLRDAKTGGVSRLTSALTVHNVMLEEYPEALERLYRGYVFHRRGEEKPGDPPYTPYRVPVYSNTEEKVSARYVRTYVEAGEAAAGRPMGEAELAVLDRFEEVTKRPELMLEFTLQPGEMYFINNYTILHARTAFEDFEEEDRRRHLLRLWLEVPQLRPVHPHIQSRGIEAVPGRRPPTIGAN